MCERINPISMHEGFKDKIHHYDLGALMKNFTHRRDDHIFLGFTYFKT